MGTVSIIVAIDRNNAIGKGNRLLCHLPNDLKYFKSVTQGHSVIMGRKTFDSLPNGALPNRRNIVISRNTELRLNGCEVADSLDRAIELCRNEDEVFIIGGASVYAEAIRLVDKLYITQIGYSFESADAFFPLIGKTEWKEVSRTENAADEKNRYSHDFIVLERIGSLQ